MKTNKDYQETRTITEVTKGDTYFDVNCGGLGFGLEIKHGAIPKVGDQITMHTQNGSFETIRGVDLNGKRIFYKSDGQLEEERQEWLRKNEKEKKERFKKNKPKMDKQYNALPDFFKKRIDRFRENNPDFRIDFESYELYCCEQAVVIAKACKTPEMVQKFSDLKWEEQKKMVKKLDDGHSGNTFGMSKRLAYWFLREPEVVVKAHGSLSALVGSKDYGDVPKQ